MYFYRIIGCDDEQQYLSEIISLVEKLKLIENYICFDKVIKINNDLSFIEQARELFENVPLKDFSNGALLNVMETKGYFSVTPDLNVNQKIKNAFGIMLNLYITNDRPVNLSIVVNFLTKVLLWFKEYGKSISKKSLYNPKIIYSEVLHP